MNRMRPSQIELIKTTMGEEEFKDTKRKLEFLARLSEDIKNTPVKERDKMFTDEIIDRAIEEAEEVYSNFVRVDEELRGVY